MSDKNLADVADKAVDKLAGAIENMAIAVKKVAPHAWEVMVRQQLVDGVVSLAMDLVLLVAIVAFLRWCVRVNKTLSWEDPSFEAVSTIIGGALSLFFAFWLFFSVPDHAMHVANPEYYAAMEVLQAVK